MIGDLDARRDEWRVGEKRLYEVGLPGRYNTLGQWKPIFYPSDANQLHAEARAASPDDGVAAALF